MIDFPEDEVAELLAVFPRAQKGVEGGVTYFLIPEIAVSAPGGTTADALLCPSSRDGYASRLFLSKPLATGRAKNLNASNVRILERNWHAVSWRVRGGLRLLQMVAAHLDAFRE
jgi:hypothetical protein